LKENQRPRRRFAVADPCERNIFFGEQGADRGVRYDNCRRIIRKDHFHRGNVEMITVFVGDDNGINIAHAFFAARHRSRVGQ